MENMAYNGSEYSENALFGELKKRVKLENVTGYDEYVELVDEIMEEKKRYGFFSDEEDLEQIKHNLERRWSEV